MRGWIVILSLAVVLLAAAPTSTAYHPCEVTYDTVTFCEHNESGTNGGGEDGSFWTGPVAQTIYAVTSLGAAAGAGIFGWTRVRRRRSALRSFLTDVETTYAAAKADPASGLPKLDALRHGLQASHNAARLDDSQFLQLDQKLADYIARVRVLQLERAFPALPMALFSEVRGVLKDGLLSGADLQTVEKASVHLQVPSTERQRLLAHLRRWAQTDVAAAPPRRRLAVVAN